MPNDFLTSLSSRAIQNSVMDSGNSGLRPRLASRFEPATPPTGRLFDENTEVLEAEQKRRYKEDIPEENRLEDRMTQLEQSEQRSEGRLISPLWRNELANTFPGVSVSMNENRSRDPMIQPVQFEQRSEGSLISPLRRDEVGKVVPGAIEKQEDTNGVERIGMDLHLDTLKFPSLQTAIHLQQPSSFHREKRNDPRSAPLLTSPVVIAPTEQVQIYDVQKNNDLIPVLHTNHTSNESKGGMVTGSASSLSMIDQPKVVSERIEITRRESQLLVSNIQQQLMPAISRPEHRARTAIREPEPQPATINVTIGRIEVKAASSAASPKRGTRSGNTVSLEEYLKRRQAGGS